MNYLKNYENSGIITHSIQEDNKAPIWYTKKGKEFDYKDKKENIDKRIEAYNYSKQSIDRIGFFAGQQKDKFIIILDFDVYDKTIDSGNNYVLEQFDKIKKMFYEDEAFQYFETSTCGNYACLLDITECDELINIIKSKKDDKGKEREKYSYNGLEVFVNGSNVVLPPTITKCKKHNKECQSRTFKSICLNTRNNEIKEYNSSKLLIKCIDTPKQKESFTKWITDFINLVIKPKVNEKVNEKVNKVNDKINIDKEKIMIDDNDEIILNKLINDEKRKKENVEKKKKETKEKTQKLKESLANKLLDNNDINEQMLRKLLDCMKEERFDEYEKWFNLMTIVKNAFGDAYYDVFSDYCKKCPEKYNEYENRKIWDSIKLEKYNIGYLIFIAKEDNIEKYKEYQKLFNADILINEKTLADYIYMYNNNFIVQDNNLYYFNNRIWLYGKEAENYMKGYISNELYMFILSDILINYAHSREYPELIKSLQKYCMTTKHKEQIIKTLFEKKQNYNSLNKIIFDKEEQVFMFLNGAYDLNKNKFIHCNKDNVEYFRSLFCTLDCGYKYEKPNNQDIKFINDLLDKMFLYNQQHKNKFLEIISTGLIAKLNQRLHIFVGGGGNGKSLILEYVKSALGSYFVNGQVELILTNSRPTSDAKASLHNKRLCLFSEPDSNEKINNAYMKGVTGESKIVGKNLYETVTEKNNTNTFVLLTNDLPIFKTIVTNGEIRRIDILEFKATFTNDKSLIDNKTIFQADETLSNIDKQEYYKFALFELLVKAYQNYKQRNHCYENIEEFEISKQKYINKSETTLNNIYNLIEKTTDNTYIKIKDLYSLIKESESYDLMTSTEKKKFTKENLIEYMEKSILFKKNFTVIDKVKCLINYKFKQIDEEDYDDKATYQDEQKKRLKLNFN